ncbi:MAG: DNRLRE domain-containing protein, partial [Candidatus Limnocylindria bacterium]
GDSTWGTPFKLPGNGTSVADDDISSVVAFGGDKIGVFWSNQKGSSFHFAVHDDTAFDDFWGNSVGVYPGAGNADDHMNLKSLQTDGSGRVFAVVKTSLTGSSSASIVLLVRSTSAVWTANTIWTKSDGLTRPIVMIDTSNSRIHAFAAKESGGPVYTKTSALSSIGFAGGLGTTVMLDASNNDINNPTSTKQNVSSVSGLLVLASNDTTSRYWHHFDPLGGSPPNPAPVASFTAAPTSGTAPLSVAFTDTSTGSPTSWAWDFESDGTTDAPTQNASHTYTAAGSYTVKLTVSNANGSNSTTRTVNVSAPGGGGGTLTLTPTDDTYVDSGAATSVKGNGVDLRVRSSSRQLHTYLKFSVAGAGSVSNAKLRLWVTDASTDGGSLYLVPDSSWSESSMSWSNKKPISGTVIASAGAVAVGTWAEFDVSSIVTGDGTYSFALISSASNVARYASSEASAATRPQLVVSGGSPPNPAPVGGGGGTLTLTPTDDTYVDATSTSAINGSLNNLRVRQGSTELQTYLKFSVAGAGSVSNAKLRLWVTDASTDGGSLYLVPDSSWSESSMSWSNKKPTSGTVIASAGAVAVGTWAEFDVSSIVTGDGTYSFALINAANDLARYDSREASAAAQPQLILTAP